MKKLVDAAIVAALLMISIPDPPQSAFPGEQPPSITEITADDSHGDRPC